MPEPSLSSSFCFSLSLNDPILYPTPSRKTMTLGPSTQSHRTQADAPVFLQSVSPLQDPGAMQPSLGSL